MKHFRMFDLKYDLHLLLFNPHHITIVNLQFIIANFPQNVTFTNYDLV